jgi:hypothetical protein
MMFKPFILIKLLFKKLPVENKFNRTIYAKLLIKQLSCVLCPAYFSSVPACMYLMTPGTNAAQHTHH